MDSSDSVHKLVLYAAIPADQVKLIDRQVKKLKGEGTVAGRSTVISRIVSEWCVGIPDEPP